MKRTGKIVLGLLGCILMMACPKAQNIVTTCEQLKRLATCESTLNERLPREIDCEALKSEFEFICTKQDVEIAYDALKNQADKVCALQKKEEIPRFDLASLESKISRRCYHADIEAKFITDTLEGMDEL